MRVGFDAKRAFANKTGLGNYSRFVLDALNTYESQHTYLAYTPRNNRQLFEDFPAENIRLPHRFLDKKISAYWRYTRITSQLRDERVDLFHGLSNEIPQGIAKTGIKSVVTIHDLIFEKLPHLFKPVDRMIYRHKFRSACEKADAIVAISEQTKNDLIDLYHADPAKIDVIYQDSLPLFTEPVDIQKRIKILETYQVRSPYILCVGTLEERKNQHRLVEAFAALPKSDLKLVLVGKPTGYLSKIQESIQKFGLQNRVILLHHVPHTHLPAIYQHAEMFAYVSVYEGFGIPIVEALHSGIPVIATKGSCLEEAGGNGALYANPLKPEEIAEQLLAVHADGDLRKTLVSNGSTHVKKFAGKVIAKQLVDLYERL